MKGAFLTSGMFLRSNLQTGEKMKCILTALTITPTIVVTLLVSEQYLLLPFGDFIFWKSH
ncbi:hypothetical protein NIES4071_100950 (plasmid) [Calothrix sp. NIES-4071]|nr:hypothetical protein NIES4071_100950 [Calothrix sp. NIES-4071]BAZ64476.1 hypothetical protein NIES4105_102090 [Calothrix sp. NIES-4105]